jgi:(p)ppGpp synthase/HD superfamily hydrolase
MAMDEDPPFVADRVLVREALQWAETLHHGQSRDVDQAPFVLHPAEVAALLSARGYDDEVVAAGLLHDAVEDSEAQVADVRERFGERVAAIVSVVTEDPAIADYHARKADLRAKVASADRDALAVFAADKLVKARELRAEATRADAMLEDPGLLRRRAHYQHSLEMLLDAAPELPIVQLLAFELWALRVLPPR